MGGHDDGRPSPLFCDPAWPSASSGSRQRLVTRAAATPPTRPAGRLRAPLAGGASRRTPRRTRPSTRSRASASTASRTRADARRGRARLRRLAAPVQVELPHLADPVIGPCWPTADTGSSRSRTCWASRSRDAGAGHAAGDRGPAQRRRTSGRLARPRGRRRRPPDTDGLPWHEEFPREVACRASATSCRPGSRATSRCGTGSSPAAAACRDRRRCRADGRCGDRARPPPPRRPDGAAVGPARDAADAGCDVAVIMTQPGSRPSKARSARASTCSTRAPCW